MIKYIYILLLFFPISLWSQLNYYYYQGKKIILEPRPDKLAVILNQTLYTKNVIEQKIKEELDPMDGLEEIHEGAMLINFNSWKSNDELAQYRYRLERKNYITKFVTPVYYGDSKKVSQVPIDEFIVRLKNFGDLFKFNQLNSLNGVQILDNIQDEKGFLLKTTNGIYRNGLELSEEYFQTGLFEFCEPNFVYPEGGLLNYIPNDTYFTSQWALRNTGQSVATEGSSPYGDATTVSGIPDADMDVDLAWDFTTGSSSVKIGVIDTGIDSTHPDLLTNIIAGYDAYWNRDGVPKDSGNHGTACAGLIGAVINNSLGVAGIAPGCKIMSIRIFNSAGSTTDAAIIRAFDTAKVRGIDILSNSWGGGTPTSSKTNAINDAAINGRSGKGCIILFSSGNDGRNPPNYPSYLENVICVGASTTHDQKKASGTGNQFWWGGNWGGDSNGDLDCVAPTICYTTDVQGTGGYNTSSGTAGDYYATFNGTSCSCPNAAGVAALVLSVNTALTRSQVTEYFLRGCEKIDNVPYSTSKTYGRWNEYHGYGRVNAYNSVRLAAGIDITPPTINHKNAASHSSTQVTRIDAEIIDQDGTSVPSTGNLQPKLYYRTNRNNAGWSGFDSITASSVSSNSYTFYIPCQGWETQVQYYIIARDNSGNETTFPKGAPNSFWLCYFAVGQITTSSNKNSAFSIATTGTSQSSDFTIGNFTIIDTKLHIYLRHTYISDIRLILKSPSSDANQNRKSIFSRNGGSGQNITGATVSDSMTTYWRESAAPYTNGSYKPEMILNGLNGTSANGNWKIIIYDGFTGDGGTCDSIRVTLYRTTGTTSPSARLNSAADSTIDFGLVSFPSIISNDFYLKNNGNSSLSIGTVSFTGSYAYMFSLDNTPPSSIAVNDSGLFRVKLNTQSLLKNGKSINDILSIEGAVMNIITNDPSKSNFQVSLQTENPLPLELLSFSANVRDRDVTLKWKTATEVNVFGFDVERQQSAVNKDRSADWEKVGFVRGFGNSASPKDYTYADTKINSGKYIYRLKMIDNDGTYEYSGELKVEIDKPAVTDMAQNYPNAFNTATKIEYQLVNLSNVRLEVYSITGEKVATLINEALESGYYHYYFDAGRYGLSSGVYIYRMIAADQVTKNNVVKTKKMLFLK